MRIGVAVLVLFVLTGCETGKQNFQAIVEEPGTLLRDPGFAQYQEDLDACERAYLKKDITYVEYLEKKQRIEDRYNRDIETRRRLIEDRRDSRM